MTARSRVATASLILAIVLAGCSDGEPTAPADSASEPARAFLQAAPTPTASPAAGGAVEILVNPVGLGFGEVQVGATSAAQTADVTNVGLVPIVMSGAGGAPGGDFSGSQNCQGRTLAPGESCQMTFSYSPTSAGPASAASSGTWNGQPYSIALSGTGVPPRFQLTPAGIDFGDAQVGTTSAQRMVDVTNVGLAEVVMSGAGGAPGGDFSGSQNCQGRTLAPGESCQMTFSYSPTTTGPASATSSGSWNGQPFSIPLAGRGLPPVFQLTPAGADFGEVEVGTTSAQRVVDVTNVGIAQVVMSGAGGAPGGDFNGSQNCQGRTLAPGESCQMTFSYSPTSTGPASATSSGSWNGQPFSIPLAGVGLAPGATPTHDLLVVTSALDFARVQVGSTSPAQTVDIVNVSSAPVTMSGAGGAPGGDFTGSQNCQGRILAPGEACQMSFSFSPTSAGPAAAVSSGSWNGQSYSIALSGTGEPPRLVTTSTALDFARVQVQTVSPTQAVDIVNQGLAPVVMSGAGGAPGGDFNGSQNCQGMTLAPGESCQISFSYAPTSAGPASAVSSGLWNGQPFRIDLSGTGVPPTFLVTPTGLDFGTVVVGATSPIETVDVINRGLAPVVVSGAGGAPGGDFNGAQNCQGVTLAPGESCQISYTFSPTSPGDVSATSSGSWNGQPYLVDLFGFGGTPYIVVDVDIKPGDPLNKVNLGASGGLPVAILGSTDFDVSTVDPATVTLADAPVIVRPNGRIAAALEDVNEDGIPDLVVHVDRTALNLAPDATFALLEGQTTDGTAIRGVDGVAIVP